MDKLTSAAEQIEALATFILGMQATVPLSSMLQVGFEGFWLSLSKHYVSTAEVLEVDGWSQEELDLPWPW